MNADTHLLIQETLTLTITLTTTFLTLTLTLTKGTYTIDDATEDWETMLYPEFHRRYSKSDL